MSRSSIALKIAASKLFRGSSQGSDFLVGREDELRALDAAWSGAERKNVITIVAWGGVGKTSLVARWAADMLAKENHGGIERYFDWSFYSQGTRTEGDATGADKAASSDIFVKEALRFFGDPGLAISNADAWEKGEHLARLVAEHRTLLILDGLEPLQDAKNGELRDEALGALLRGLASYNRGLCLVTTRQRLPELNTWHQTAAPEWKLEKLSKEAGAELLANLGVKGTPIEREQLSTDVKGHALTLTLLGKYLAEAHRGDIRKRELVSLTEADYDETSGHAFHVMEAYERWLDKDGRRVELAVLRLLGLFDRPATPDCLAALRIATIPGLTDTIAALTDAQWDLAVKRLNQLGLVEEQPWEADKVVGYSEEDANKVWASAEVGHALPLGEPQGPLVDVRYSISNSIDAHPLIREYFGRRLREEAPLAWRAAHSSLFEHLRGSVPYWPEGLEGLHPLYQAVAHGCQAGRYQETCFEVYVSRILRGASSHQGGYSVKHLGALGADLAAVGCFFVAPWTKPAPELTEVWQAWLLNEAAFRLRSLGRLTEAREPMWATLKMNEGISNWRNSAAAASNLSELDLTLGEVACAVHEAEQSVVFADRSDEAFHRMSKRCTHADALHQAGRNEQARALFEEAADIQRQRQPVYPLLYSLAGFRFCDLLLAHAERAAWRTLLESAGLPALSPDDSAQAVWNSRQPEVESSREPVFESLQTVKRYAMQTIEWVISQGGLVDVALDHLSLGRVALYRAILEPSSVGFLNSELPSHLNAAVQGFRQANAQHHLPRGLLTRALLRTELRQTAEGRADLDEAQQIAERGPMRLHLADIHLHRARLFFREDLANAREDLRQARTLIEKCGYLRRMPELEDAEKVILAVK